MFAVELPQDWCRHSPSDGDALSPEPRPSYWPACLAGAPRFLSRKRIFRACGDGFRYFLDHGPEQVNGELIRGLHIHGFEAAPAFIALPGGRSGLYRH